MDCDPSNTKSKSRGAYVRQSPGCGSVRHCEAARVFGGVSLRGGGRKQRTVDGGAGDLLGGNEEEEDDEDEGEMHVPEEAVDDARRRL
jgi:hypothetical protein